MGFVYEVSTEGTLFNQPVAHVYHVWDGDENETPDDVADVFENNHLVDLAVQQSDHLTWSRISVVPLDVGNGLNPVTRVVSIAGSIATDTLPTGVHVWAKFESDDNGFKSGGKLVTGMVEAGFIDGVVGAATIAALQTIYDDLISDLGAASLSLAIYRPTLSTPGFPSISICSAVSVRGVGTNNRRQQAYQI